MKTLEPKSYLTDLGITILLPAGIIESDYNFRFSYTTEGKKLIHYTHFSKHDSRDQALIRTLEEFNRLTLSSVLQLGRIQPPDYVREDKRRIYTYIFDPVIFRYKIKSKGIAKLNPAEIKRATSALRKERLRSVRIHRDIVSNITHEALKQLKGQYK